MGKTKPELLYAEVVVICAKVKETDMCMSRVAVTRFKVYYMYYQLKKNAECCELTNKFNHLEFKHAGLLCDSHKKRQWEGKCYVSLSLLKSMSPCLLHLCWRF